VTIVTGHDGGRVAQNKKNLMGLREYARHRGVSLAAVQDAIKKDKLTAAIVTKGKNKKINYKTADKLWSQNTITNNKNSETMTKGADYSKARAFKESFAAKNEQLKYEERVGKLCKVDEVQRAAKDVARITRDALFTIPDKLSPLLAAESDINQVHKILMTEIHQACENISRGNWSFFQSQEESEE